MHILCKHGENYNEWYALSASDCPEPLKAEAERRNAAEHEAEHKAWLERGKTGPQPMQPGDPQRNGYQTFFVLEVADWPAVAVA